MTQINWQTRAHHFAQKRNLYHSPGVYALDLMSELGEVAKEILIASAYETQETQFRSQFADELGDVLYSLCLLASSANIDLEEAFTNTLHKYEQRWEATGKIGSQSK